MNIEITDADIDQFLVSYNSNEEDAGKHLQFDEARYEILKGWADVQACPGSGKTTLIAAKLMLLAKKWPSKTQGICVITHTNVACGEIREKLLRVAIGSSLFEYPHFIGTIQEFVNKFLALPLLRSDGLSSIRVDDEICEKFMFNSARQGTLNYLERKRESIANLKINHSDGEFNFPAFPTPSESDSYKDLARVLNKRITQGLFLYSEMYHFGKVCLSQNPDLLNSIRLRFPVVLVDEMQDTQQFQDDLIRRMFSCEEVHLQRLGDPDQAIFEGMGGESANETFNSNPDGLEVIRSTHRYGGDIASKIQGLSVSQIGEVDSFAVVNNEPFRHTIFTFSENSKENLLERFSLLIAESDPEQKWKCIKSVGGVEGNGGYISQYWSGYNRKNSVKRPRPEKLISLVRREWGILDTHSSAQYSLLIQAIVDALRISNTKDLRVDPPIFFSATALISWLKVNQKIFEFRKLITNWLLLPAPRRAEWENQIDRLCTLVGIEDRTEDLNEYLCYDALGGDEEPLRSPSTNLFEARNGREIEVATIHSVKGETHDATLILETRFHQFDLQVLANHLSLQDGEAIAGARKLAFARRLYVAASRARYLLCIAIHEDHLSDIQRVALEQNGWEIQGV